jgi:hypothetical protein
MGGVEFFQVQRGGTHPPGNSEDPNYRGVTETLTFRHQIHGNWNSDTAAFSSFGAMVKN